MNEQEKMERIISPEKFFPSELRLGKLLGNRAFIETTSRYLEVLSESQFWPREKLEMIQIERLKKLISRISARSPFWARCFSEHGLTEAKLSSVRDLALLPVLPRRKLAELGEQIYVPSLAEEEPVFTRYTGGTTGIPFRLMYSEREMIITQIPFFLRHPALEQLSLEGFLSRKPFVVMGKTGFNFSYERDFFSYSSSFLRPADLYNPELRTKIYKSIEAVAPAYLLGFGSLIAKFAQVVADDAVNLPLLAVHTTSESVSLTERQLIQQTFKAPFVNMFCSNGVGVIGFECPINPGRYHVNSEKAILEIIDENGSVLPEGREGELVVTALAYTLTPIIRYAISDTGRLFPGDCRCGRSLPLFEFQGRRDYEVVLPNGRRIRFIHVHTTLMRLGLARHSKQIQIIQSTPDNLRLLVVPKEHFSAAYEVAIRLALTNLFQGEKINIEIEYVDDIPQGGDRKIKFFIPLSEVRQ